jgi:hypothetical protein
MKPEALDASKCPLCGGSNDCRVCGVTDSEGPCWCAEVKIPDGLAAQVPPELRNKACICRNCVTKYQQSTDRGGTVEKSPREAFPF